MPRPCHAQHPPSPGKCPFCAWCTLPGEAAEKLRREWSEPEPDWKPKKDFQGRPAARVAVGDLLPGIPDPLGSSWPSPIPDGWPFDAQVREQHIAALAELLNQELIAPSGLAGDGIIYVGGGRYWPMIVVGIRMARMFTDLPIQVWYAGAAEPVNAKDVEGVQDIHLMDSTNVGFPRLRNGGWENKTTAMLFSGFRQILYLDADAYLVADPAPLFQASEKTRFVFWCDLPWNDATVDWHWLGVTNTGRVPPIQGGQLCLNVESFYRELVISDWINQHSPYTYHHQYGDQDSWRIALAATGGSYHNLGAAGWQPPAFVCRYPEPLVVHRCQAKLWGDCQVNFAHDLPWENHVRTYYNAQVIGRGPAEEVFGRIYRMGMWGQLDSSGAGGSDHESQPFIDLLSVLVKLGGWADVVDLGCGDGRVTARLPFPRVTGVDIHRPHLEALRLRHDRIQWVALDFDVDREQLPAGTVCILKDVLHHWPSSLIREWIEWARSSGKWRWVIFSHDCHQAEDGADCILGGYRALNPSMMPLSGLPLVAVMQYLHKQVLLMECDPVPAIAAKRIRK